MTGACLLLIGATGIAFAPVLDNDFFNLDDPEYVTDNPHVWGGLTFPNIGWAFTTFHAANWHPLTWLSLQLDVEINRLTLGEADGLAPSGFHRTNLVLHGTNALLLFLAWRGLTGAVWRSAFLAALFAVHPLHVESVAWVAERKDVLSTFFWMVTLLVYTGFVRRPGVGRYLAVVLVLALGLLAKPMLVTLPFVLLLLDYWPLGRFRAGQPGYSISWRGAILEKIPLFALAAADGVMTLLAQSKGKLVTSLEEVRFLARVGNALVAYLRYLGLTLWPHDLAVYYPHPRDRLSAWAVAGAAALLATLTALALALARRRPYLAVGWLWYLGTLLPVIGLVQVATQALADRYTYVPLIGLFLIISWGLPDLASRWGLSPVALAPPALIVLVVLIAATRVQVGYWRDSIPLWKHTLDVTKQNYVAHSNLGAALLSRGKPEEALRHFKAALELRPDLAGMQVGVGGVLLDQRKPAEAIPYFLRALETDPDDPRTHLYLAIAYRSRRQNEDAVRQFLEALRLHPELGEAHYGLALVYLDQDELAEAERHFTAARATNPGSAGYRIGLAQALDRMAAGYADAGDLDRARFAARQGLELARSAGQRELAEGIRRHLSALERDELR